MFAPRADSEVSGICSNHPLSNTLWAKLILALFASGLCPFLADECRASSLVGCRIEQSICSGTTAHWKMRLEAAKIANTGVRRVERFVLAENCNGRAYIGTWLLVDDQGDGVVLESHGKRLKKRRLSRNRTASLLRELSEFDLSALADYVQKDPVSTHVLVAPVSVCENGVYYKALFEGFSPSQQIDGCGVLCDLILWAHEW
ncbi:hypothetical protein ABI59_23370 [Acidobacteria bacterium Mor1]|nr:hypothetical protein ABI59_23370 [Acidobacteria bacterium Mor1]